MNEKSSDASEKSTTRRNVLAVGGIAVAGAVAAVVATPVAAEAANGSALILGKGNAATAGTVLSAITTAGALTVTNSGTGAGAVFHSTDSYGLNGGSSAKNSFGVTATNTAVQGFGSALNAAGGQNYGAIISTHGDKRYGLIATNYVTTPTPSQTGAAAFTGNNADGVVGTTAGDPTHFSGVNGYHFGGGSGVFGQGFGSGSAGVQGLVNEANTAGVVAQAMWTDHTSAALLADNLGSMADAIQARGRVSIAGDLLVSGTIYCPTDVVVGPLPPTAMSNAGKAVTRRAAATAQKIRPVQG